MRTELKICFLLFSLNIIITRFALLPANASCFLSGAFFGFGLFLIVVSLLPKNVYDNLIYRKWIASRKT